MRAARVAKSERLQRVASLLADGKPHSSLDIVRKAHVVAVSSCIAELRVNGAVIACEQRHDERGRRWIYTMTKGPDL